MGVLLCASVALRDGGPRWLWALTGVLGGLMTMVRPESGLYVAAVGVALVIGDSPQMRIVLGTVPSDQVAGTVPDRLAGNGELVWSGLALSAGFLAMLAPWTIRNAVLFRTFQPLNPRTLSMPGEFAAEGYAVWLRSWIDHPRYVGPLLFAVDRDPINIAQVPDRAFDSPAEREEVASLFRRYNTPGSPADADEEGHVPLVGMTPEIDAAFADIGRARAARHPFRHYVILPAKRAIMLWFDPHADYYPFGGYLFPWASLDPDRNQTVLASAVRRAHPGVDHCRLAGRARAVARAGQPSMAPARRAGDRSPADPAGLDGEPRAALHDGVLPGGHGARRMRAAFKRRV